MKVRNLFQKSNHSIIATILVLAAWFLIPIPVSLSQTQPVIQISPDQILFSLDKATVNISLSVAPSSFQVKEWKFLEGGKRAVSLDKSFFRADIVGKTAIFKRKNQGIGETKVTIAAIKPSGGSIEKQVDVSVFTIQLSKDYVSFVGDFAHNRRDDIKLSADPKPKKGEKIEFHFLEEDKQLKQLNKKFFSAAIKEGVVSFRRKPQEYGETKVTIAATKTDNNGVIRILAKKQISVSVFDIRTPIEGKEEFFKDYVSFYHDEKGIEPVDLELYPKPGSDEKIEWYLLDKRDDRVDKLDEEFFSAELTARFKITEQSFENLKSESVPDDVLEKLQSLKNEEAAGEEKFLGFLKREIGDEQTVRFKSLILKHAELTGNQVKFEGVREQNGESKITIVATKTIPKTPTQPELKRNIAEKEIQVSVPRDKLEFFFYSRAIYKILPLLNLKSNKGFVKSIIRGGDIMVILILLGLFGLALSGWKFWSLFQLIRIEKLSGFADRIIESVKEQVKENNSIDVNLEENNPLGENNPIAPIFQAGIEARKRKQNPTIGEEKLERVIKEEMEKNMEKEEEKLGRWTRAIEVCNILAPMIGFFGTIIGLIAAFMDWTNSAIAGENIKVEDLAGGMYQAMVTTAGGLAVAILLSTLLAIILYRIRKLTGVMSDSVDRMLKALLGATDKNESQSSEPPSSPGAPTQNSLEPQGGNTLPSSPPESTAQTSSAPKSEGVKKEQKIKTVGIFSLTDIVLNLFIFFFIAFNLIAAFKTDKESNIRDVSVPRVTDAPSVPAIIKPIKVTIEKEGNANIVRIDGVDIETLGVLTSKIKPELAKKNGIEKFVEQHNQEVPSVIIAAGEEVIYDYVMQVLNAVKNSGLLKIGLTAIPREG